MSKVVIVADNQRHIEEVCRSLGLNPRLDVVSVTSVHAAYKLNGLERGTPAYIYESLDWMRPEDIQEIELMLSIRECDIIPIDERFLGAPENILELREDARREHAYRVHRFQTEGATQ
jgi:hypothetical protein